MRTLLYMIFGLSALEATGQLTGPQTKDNTIYIISENSGDSLFSQIGQRLAKAGFPLTTTNKEFGQIVTGEKIVTHYNYSYYVVVLIEGNTATIKPTITKDLVLGDYRWYYVNRKANVNYKLTEHLMSVLEGLGDVSYGREPE